MNYKDPSFILIAVAFVLAVLGFWKPIPWPIPVILICVAAVIPKA